MCIVGEPGSHQTEATCLNLLNNDNLRAWADRGQQQPQQKQKKRAGKRLLSMGGELERAGSEDAQHVEAQQEVRTKRRR